MDVEVRTCSILYYRYNTTILPHARFSVFETRRFNILESFSALRGRIVTKTLQKVMILVHPKTSESELDRIKVLGERSITLVDVFDPLHGMLHSTASGIYERDRMWRDCLLYTSDAADE